MLDERRLWLQFTVGNVERNKTASIIRLWKFILDFRITVILKSAGLNVLKDFQMEAFIVPLYWLMADEDCDTIESFDFGIL